MIINKGHILALSLAVALSACSDRAEPQASAELQPSNQAPAAPTGGAIAGNRLPSVAVPAGDPVNLPAGEGENAPLVIDVGQTVIGSAAAPRDGQVLAVDVFVGNYVDTSDGTLSLKLCSNGICRIGSGSLLSSVDNSMFTIILEESLPVSEKSQLTYEFTKQDGAVPIVIWTYPVLTSGENQIQYKDGDTLGRSPKITLHYAK